MSRLLVSSLIAAVFALSGHLWAQEVENVQVLPFETHEEIIPFMQGTIAKSLGVKCGFCHNVKDFPSDDNPHKRVAREMMRMLGDINEHMKSIQKVARKAGLDHWEEAPVVECWACHRGTTEPEYKRP